MTKPKKLIAIAATAIAGSTAFLSASVLVVKNVRHAQQVAEIEQANFDQKCSEFKTSTKLLAEHLQSAPETKAIFQLRADQANTPGSRVDLQIDADVEEQMTANNIAIEREVIEEFKAVRAANPKLRCDLPKAEV